MELCEPEAHSFVVKIWLEEGAGDSKTVCWRGHITHVASGQRRYLKDLDDVTAFIAPFMKAAGARSGFFSRARWQVFRVAGRIISAIGRLCRSIF